MPQAPRTEEDEYLGARPRRDTAQSVNLTDRIHWQWYAVAAALPLLGALVGFVAGIVFMARSKIGPALALWATSWLALVVWGVVGWVIVLNQAFNEIANEAEVPAFTRSTEELGESTSESDQPTPSPQDEDPAPSPADPSTGANTEARKACGNLTATRGSITCEFAQNVFYEYWTATDGGSSPIDRISAYSPALRRELQLSCDVGVSVSCFTEAGGEVRIPVGALGDYTQADADAYAASNTVSK